GVEQNAALFGDEPHFANVVERIPRAWREPRQFAGPLQQRLAVERDLDSDALSFRVKQHAGVGRILPAGLQTVLGDARWVIGSVFAVDLAQTRSIARLRKASEQANELLPADRQNQPDRVVSLLAGELQRKHVTALRNDRQRALRESLALHFQAAVDSR